MTNRLGDATSPYLQQHAQNPVHWWQWGPEAFEHARQLDIPILLSIGYSACHWCHVMAHESFEDPAVAAIMNANFVSIKVDREERPDVDSIYMEAVQRLTGSGGWPLTAFLDHEGAPFYAGTYYPPTPRHGMPSFVQLMEAITEAWNERREGVLHSAKQVVESLQAAETLRHDDLSAAMLDAGYASLASSFDAVRGGFGGAPKFPPSMCLEFLLRHHSRTGRGLELVHHTCERMARGGMYDQLAGGFARYSVDPDWVVPHFEKMLYDNALLLRVYVHLARAEDNPLARRVVAETAQWMLSELLTEQGGFASALDADSLDADGHSHEGAFYVWSPGLLTEVLGSEDGAWAASLLEVTGNGTFEHGYSTAQLLAEPNDAARWARVKGVLKQERDKRPRPARDDKIVAAWNGLAIAALAEAGVLLEDPSLIVAATRAAELLHSTHWVNGRLRRVSRDGVVGAPDGVLEDYGDVAEGLLQLHQVTGERRWLDWAGELLEIALAHFAAPNGGFFDTADDAEALIVRPRDEMDNATPSGQAALAGALLTYAALTLSSAHRARAEGALRSAAPLVAQHARFAGWSAAVGEAMLAGPLEIAVVDRPDLEGIARSTTSPGAVVVASPAESPLMADRPMPGAYVCERFVCDAPLSESLKLAARIGARVA